MNKKELTLFCDRNKHISNAEVQADIADTLAEIHQLEARKGILRMELDNATEGIRKRRAFVKQLAALLDYRVSQILGPAQDSPAPPAQD